MIPKFDPSILRYTAVDMKKVLCSYEGCSDRRAHFERPDECRPHQEFWVPADHSGPYYCSIECSVYDKAKKELTTDASKEQSPQPDTHSEGPDSQGPQAGD